MHVLKLGIPVSAATARRQVQHQPQRIEIRGAAGILTWIRHSAAKLATIKMADDAVVASYQAVVLAPLGPADQYELLTEPGPDARVRALERLLDGVEEIVRFDMTAPRPDDPERGGS